MSKSKVIIQGYWSFVPSLKGKPSMKFQWKESYRADTVFLMMDRCTQGQIDTVNTLRPRQNGRYFADDIFKCIFLNKNASIAIKISLKFVLGGRINNIPALVQIMAWHWLGDKPLSEPMMVSLLTHICITWLQWVKIVYPLYFVSRLV